MIVKHKDDNEKKLGGRMEITLALGGGGARGNSHIGVIRVLENAGCKIRAVAGSSAGGIVAACYAAGHSPNEMESYFSNLDQTRLYARSSNEGPSILGLSGVTKWLDELFGDLELQDLSIPCGITAVDVKSACEVVLTEGRVVDAILATIALPGIFPPFEKGDALLVDGGVLDPVPVSIARSLAPNLPVVAVVLTPFLDTEGHLKGFQLPKNVPAPLVERINRFRLAQAFNIFLAAVDAGGRMLTELRLEIDDPEVIIRPEVGHIGLLDKVDVHEIVRLGEHATLSQIELIRLQTSWTGKLRRQFERKFLRK
jgi:NTE family protein